MNRFSKNELNCSHLKRENNIRQNPVVKILRYIFSLLILSTCASLSLFAQKYLSEEEAIATALQNNYDIQLSRNDSMVAALDYSYRNAVFLPRINANAGNIWNRNNQKQEFSTGTKREGKVKTNSLNASVALNWTLFDGLRMFATKDKAQQFIQLGELGIRLQIVNTVASVINTYYGIVRQKQQLKAILEQMSINEERVKLAERKLDIGVGTKPDVLQSQVDLNAQRAARLNQLMLIVQLKEQLNQLMNVQQGTSYEVSDTIPLNMNLSLGDIQSGIETTNPQLQVAKKNIEIANLTLRERRAERFPTVSFNSAYNFTRTNNDVALNPALPIFNRNKGFNYGFTATIPILNGFNTRRLIRQAQLDINYNQLFFENQRSLVNLDMINAYLNYEQQKSALELEEANILLARENVNISVQTYRLGAFTFIQLRESQKSLEDAYNRLIAARYNAKVAETELLRLKGQLVR